MKVEKSLLHSSCVLPTYGRDLLSEGNLCNVGFSANYVKWWEGLISGLSPANVIMCMRYFTWEGESSSLHSYSYRTR